MPERLTHLNTWLRDQLGLTDYQIAPASGDASFRRYFRLSLPGGETRIAMDAPPQQEDCRPFIHVAGLLAQTGVHVPGVLQQDLDQGFLLLSDLGTRTYLEHLDEASADRLYGDALGALLSIQACASTDGLPPYDEALLQREMDLFEHWLVNGMLELQLDAAATQDWENTRSLLVANALEQPQVFVHRDYHSRNLMLLDSANPGILDFQDAVLGPVTYDLVSLLRDCYIRWPRTQVEDWVMGYCELAIQSGVLRPQHEADFLRWFDLMGVQRHLKAAGIFARLNQRDGKPGYLQDIPRTLGYIVETARRHAELENLGSLIEQQVLPGLEAHPAIKQQSGD